MRRFQFIHYPKGGGFFDWHEHPRYPVNYGMILNRVKRISILMWGNRDNSVEWGNNM